MSEIKYSPDIATLIIDLPATAIDLENTKHIAGAVGLNQKPEFHVTIIGNNTGQELLSSFQGLKFSERCEKLIEIGKLAKSFDWNITLKPDTYVIEKQYPDGELRTSIIQKAQCDNVVPFYQGLEELTGLKFELPFLHATLFTTSTNEINANTGIGIYSDQDFKSLNPQRI